MLPLSCKILSLRFSVSHDPALKSPESKKVNIKNVGMSNVRSQRVEKISVRTHNLLTYQDFKKERVFFFLIKGHLGP